MRLANILGGLAAVLLFPNLALAEPLPQRWVSSGGALSEWVVLLGGESIPDLIIARMFNYAEQPLLQFSVAEKADVDLKALFSA